MGAVAVPIELEKSLIKPCIDAANRTLMRSSPNRKISLTDLVRVIFWTLQVKHSLRSLENETKELAQIPEWANEDVRKAMRETARTLDRTARRGHQSADWAEKLMPGYGRGKRLLHGNLMRLFIRLMRPAADRIEDLSEAYALGASEKFAEFVREEVREFA